MNKIAIELEKLIKRHPVECPRCDGSGLEPYNKDTVCSWCDGLKTWSGTMDYQDSLKAYSLALELKDE